MSDMAIVVHNKGSAYSGVTAQFVNLTQETSEFHEISTDPHQHLARIGGLGDVTVARFPRAMIDEIRAKAAKWSHVPDPELRNDILVDHVESKYHLDKADATRLVENLDSDTEGMDPQVIESLFDGDLTAMRAAAFDFLELREMQSASSVQYLSKQAHLANEHATAQRLGILDVLHIEQFPMALVHAGYRRAGDMDALRTARVRLHEPDRETGRYTVYAETFNTEALLFIVDPAKIAAWLDVNWPKLPWHENLRRGFQAGCRSRKHVNGLADCDRDRKRQMPLNPQGHHTFMLLHSLSHAAVQAASSRSGFAANSLKEHINVGALTFAITVNKNYQQSLGGLDALFDNGLAALFERMEIGTMDCIQDPVCMHGTEAACYACLHLSETSCPHFNSHLDRRYLHGDGRSYSGFWQ